MFEGQPQSEIDALIKVNPEFKQLYQQHQKLNKKCMDAELGVLPIDDMTLGQMKREKLLAKQKLLRIYEERLLVGRHCPRHLRRFGMAMAQEPIVA